jgi:hypothetical protein
MRLSWIGVSILAAVVTCAAPAHADQRYFTYTYDWFTPAQGEKEVELLWTQAEGGNVDTEFEFEYGITNRWLVAPYLLAHREHGGDWEVEGWKLEQRYRFGDFHYNRFLPAVYFEVKKENHEAWELEGKLITTYTSNHGWLWSTNLIFESAVENNADLEVGYASGISFKVNDRVRAGAEFFGEWTPDQEHFFGPTATYLFNPSTRLLATVGFRYLGGEGGAVRVMFEKEWR